MRCGVLLLRACDPVSEAVQRDARAANTNLIKGIRYIRWVANNQYYKTSLIRNGHK